MTTQTQRQARFVASFVDSVTVRPFFDDLKRIKTHRQLFGSLPEVDEPARAA